MTTAKSGGKLKMKSTSRWHPASQPVLPNLALRAARVNTLEAFRLIVQVTVRPKAHVLPRRVVRFLLTKGGFLWLGGGRRSPYHVAAYDLRLLRFEVTNRAD